MAYIIREDEQVLPKRAASAIAAFSPVRSSASAVDEVLPVATANVVTLGLSIATVPTAQTGCAVQTTGIAKAVAAASIGVGALVAVGSTNGRLAVAASGQQIVGESVGPAADGEVFSVLLKPRQPTAP